VEKMTRSARKRLRDPLARHVPSTTLPSTQPTSTMGGSVGSPPTDFHILMLHARASQTGQHSSDVRHAARRPLSPRQPDRAHR
jgi:hypothetical protein